MGKSRKRRASYCPWPPETLTRALGCDQIWVILELNSPLFGTQKGPDRAQNLCSDPEYDCSVLGVDFGGHLGPFGAILERYKRKNWTQKIVLEPF